MTMVSVQNACDMHMHTSPDIFDRVADDVQMAQICRDAGMRAIVFKSHADTTMTRAWHTERQVPGIRVFGGITLNLQSGGLNPAAVDVALQLGAVQVWMPSYHSLAHYRETGKMGGYGHQGADVTTDYPVEPVTILDEKGCLKPEVLQIIELVRRYDAVLGTSHLSADEALLLIKAARDVGCRKVLLIHPFFAPPSCTVQQVKQAVDLGAYVEFCAGNALSSIPKHIPLALYTEAIEACGVEQFIISSDCGHPRKTYPPETIRMFAQSLTYKGVKAKQLEQMMVHNYDKLLPLG